MAAGEGVGSSSMEAAESRSWLDHMHDWVTTVDHKKLGILYIMSGLFFFVIGGVEASLMRAQLAVAGNTMLEPEEFNRLFTMHGTTMVFLVGMPIVTGFGNYLIPLMIGARDMAFPRLNAWGFWMFLFGGIVLYLSYFASMGLYGAGTAPDVGWFAYSPLTGRAFSRGNATDYWILGILLSGFGSMSGAINMVTTSVTMRAPGMTMGRIPLFVWMMLVVSFLMLLALPVLTAQPEAPGTTTEVMSVLPLGEVQEVTTNAMKIYEDMGAIIEPLNFKYNIKELSMMFSPILGALGYNKNGQLLDENPDKLMNYTKRMLEAVKNWEGPIYMNAISELYKFRNYMDSIFENYDYIATPTMAVPAHECGNPPEKINGIQYDYSYGSDNNEMISSYGDSDNIAHKNGAGLLSQFTAIFNWSGNPAATIPCGFSSKGLPISLQIAGEKENELGVLQASRAFEIVKPWHNKKPKL